MSKQVFALLVVALFCTLGRAAVQADEDEDFFEAKIRPVLVNSCFRCHGGTKTSGDLRIDSREALVKGGDSGSALVSGNPEESLLIRAIQRQDGVSAMPPEKDKSLRADQVADFVTWIKQGAVWPAKTAKFESSRHWAFEPFHDAAPPEVADKAWTATSVDPFIRAKQEAAGIRPAAPADKLKLIRRATFDLTGLPPTPQHVAAFLRDESPEAFARVVDRLLESKAYGERWGRHWLDVVRYADTAGETADYPAPQAWRYRNYVVDSFNSDKPYDEFLREQIAGDILANQGSAERYAERVVATGYLAISRRFGFDSENYHHLTIQDTVDTLGQSVLGLSLGCCRCHDHKFDALSMRDYYALYGIFDSTRYPFPGSEQKPKVRSLAPLLPRNESEPKWHQFEQRLATLTTKLNQPVADAVLRPTHEMDGDFELQAPAAGGSNGVLVSPWLYEGKVTVTNGAQSPYKNFHALGKVGASVAVNSGPYRFAQAIHRAPNHSQMLHVNLDFRVTASDGAKGLHRFCLTTKGAVPAAEVLIAADAISLRQGENIEKVADLKLNVWHNLQLTVDLKGGIRSGRIGTPEAVTEFTGKSLPAAASGDLDCVVFDSPDAKTTIAPTIEFDNLGVQEMAFAPVSTSPPVERVPPQPTGDPAAIVQQLQSLSGVDGDFELQTKDSSPASPWGPGPNSVVKLSDKSQSPYRNLFAAGELGIHMPNRRDYDGFGLTLPNVKPDAEGRLHVAFDFRCASKDAGGEGSWRYYVGHGPGNSAAVELFFNGKELFCRSGVAREAIAPIAIGRWYQIQMTLDLKAKTYQGTLAFSDGKTEFTGQLASGWDGVIDYSFIDSYGHLDGVRPSLDADNFVYSDKPLPALDATVVKATDGSLGERRAKVADLRKQLAAIQRMAADDQSELNQLLADGPFAMAYAMAEGTPHNVRVQLRGEPDQPGDEVPRGFISVLGGGTLAAETNGSGRLELAQWLTRADNPLTARVMVNRIWQYHFDRGLVQTPNDFGMRGRVPTHPELLDHLASQFIRNGWSVKAMHRLIMLSSTYRQATATDSTTAELYSGLARRRLSAEEIRDAILSVSGELDATPGRQHPFPSPISWGYSQHGPFSAVYEHNQRSIYLMTQRLKRHPFLALFDGADPNATTPQRLATTVPTQALFFLNDPFIHAKSEKWAQRLLTSTGEESRQVDQAWLQSIGRVPSDSERSEAVEFLAAYRTESTAASQPNIQSRPLAAYIRTILGSNEFLHVD